MRTRLFLLLPLFFFLTSCSFLAQPKLEQPTVSLSSIKVLPSESLKPKFEIGLKIVNPNAIPLSFKGLSYSMAIEGFKVINGVSQGLPTIPANGEETVYINAIVDLKKSFALLSILLKDKLTTAHYSFNAELAPKGPLPKIQFAESGEFFF